MYIFYIHIPYIYTYYIYTAYTNFTYRHARACTIPGAAQSTELTVQKSTKSENPKIPMIHKHKKKL